MCFRCTKIAIIVFYGFRLLSVFFFAPMPSTTLNTYAAIIISYEYFWWWQRKCCRHSGAPSAAPKFLWSHWTSLSPSDPAALSVRYRFHLPMHKFILSSVLVCLKSVNSTVFMIISCFDRLSVFRQFRSVLFVATGFIVTLLCIQIPLAAAHLSVQHSSAMATKPNRIVEFCMWCDAFDSSFLPFVSF